ncbi:MAG: type II toxin-antitoxin system VapC family toxin [Fimbriimonadales bacterium]|nr:type II toxin-antitoxin system VapC family toxin [Fimbriimonadales bacterium]
MNPIYFLDTSALAKLYIQETGTTWVQQIVATCRPNQLYVSSLARVEMASAVTRRQRAGNISASEAQRILSNFDADWGVRCTIITVDEEILERAYTLVRTYGLRAYDAVHLAVALELQGWFVLLGERTLTLLSADNALLQCAQQEGLSVDNPTNHP